MTILLALQAHLSRRARVLRVGHHLDGALPQDRLSKRLCRLERGAGVCVCVCVSGQNGGERMVRVCVCICIRCVGQESACPVTSERVKPWLVVLRRAEVGSLFRTGQM
jgi:hypothetical protein